MPRIVVWTVLTALLALTVEVVHGQPADAPASQPPPEHLNQLQKCREGLVDPEARPEDRRRWAELLFSYSSPDAMALVVELLGAFETPDVQRAVCAVLADRARERPERLDPGFIEPLMDLLGAESEDLRTMAAGALADFPGADVPAKLGALAARTDVPVARRLAAIDALAPNTHRREVVGQLIGLLDAEAAEITDRVVDALESATPETFGSDADGWRQWWTEKSRLDEEAWLAEQLQIYRDRARRLADEFSEYRAVTQREQAAVTSQLRSFQRELFRTGNGEQRDAKLTEWLGDPLPVVRLTAVSIIKARMADEGKRPEGQVLTALLGALREGPPPIRREALEIVQNLNDPAVVEAVLSQLARETDLPTRLAIFKAIGRLDRPETIPALVQEITSASSSSECVREAAIALGHVATEADTAGDLKDAVRALKSRFDLTADEDVAMRAALLAAMAGLADAAFAPEFLGAVESDDERLLQPAIRGLLAIGEGSKLPRLRTLMGHGDPLVRLAATEAVGRLGREDADLESLLNRLNPDIEPNELPREAAWRGFRRFLSTRPVPDRIKAAERLREMPEAEVRYLKELADTLAGANGTGGDLETVLDRLSTVLVAEGHFPEAVPYLRSLCELRAIRSDEEAFKCGLRLLDAVLRDPTAVGLCELLQRLAAEAADAAARTRVVTHVSDYLESDAVVADTERTQSLIADLRTVPTDILGESWSQMLERAAARFESDGKEPEPPPSPNP